MYRSPTTRTIWAFILLATIAHLPTAGASPVAPTSPLGTNVVVGDPPAGDRPAWSSPLAISGANRVTTTIVADFDGDGTDDFAAFEGGKHAGGYKLFAWFEHTGGSSFAKHPFNAGFRDNVSWEFLGSAAPADLDGDGDIDIVFTMDHHSGGTQEGKVLWIENPGGNATGTWDVHEIHHFTSGTEHINDMAITDFDGDGKLDVAIRHLGQNRVRILFQNSLTNWTAKTIDVAPREGMNAGDLDGDGRPDLLLNGFWLHAPANPRTGNWTRYDIDDTFYNQPDQGLNNATKNALADIDGDGDLDAVISTAEGAPGKLAWYENDGSPLNGGWTEHTLQDPWENMHQVEVGDFDGDGSLDLMGGLAFGDRDIYVWYLDDGAFLQRQRVTSAQGLYFGKAGDLDGDGDLDIVGPTQYTGQMYVYFADTDQGGNTAPNAAFSASTSGLTASFTDTSSDPDGSIASWDWDFGDGAGSTSQNPSHTYGSEGTYTVELTVTDNDGATDTATRTVTLTADEPDENTPPNADFSTSTAGLTASFTDASSDPDGSIVGWSWDFGDGASSTIQNPSHTYSSEGTFEVSLTVTDDAGATDTATRTVTLTVNEPDENTAPNAAFSASTSGLTASFTDTSSDPDGSIASWDWDFGDGAGSTSQNPSHTYGSEGTYTVELTVTDNDGATDTATRTVTLSLETPDSEVPYAADLALHLEADQGLAVNQGTVSAWADQSGYGNDLTASNSPQLTTAPTGAPAIALDGDKLERVDLLHNLPAGNDDRALFAVLRYHEAEAWGGVAYGRGSSNNTFGLIVEQQGGTTARNLTLQGWGKDQDLVSDEPGILSDGSSAGWLVQSAVLAGGTATLFKDGAPIGAWDHDYDTVLDRIVIGSEIADLGYVRMDVAAVLVFDRALSEAERAEVEAYLQGKYMEGAEAGEVVFAVNAGGEAFTTADGIAYAADSGYTGGHSNTTEDPIAGTSDDALYQSERFGNFSYAIPVAAGTYEVSLHLAEIHWSDAGRRVFSAEAEGTPIVSGLDLYAEVGHDAAYDVTATVEVTDGTLDLTFSAEQNFAKIGALLVRSMGEGGPTTTSDPGTRPEVRTAGDWTMQVYPNPATTGATFEYALDAPDHVRLDLYDGLGRRVTTLVDAQQETGAHRVHLDRMGLTSGVYHWRLRAGDRTESGQLTLVR